MFRRSCRPVTPFASKLPGFKVLTEHVTLLADQVRALDERLEIGQASQQVTVEASAVLVNTVTPVLSQVIEQTRVV